MTPVCGNGFLQRSDQPPRCTGSSTLSAAPASRDRDISFWLNAVANETDRSSRHVPIRRQQVMVLPGSVAAKGRLALLREAFKRSRQERGRKDRVRSPSTSRGNSRRASRATFLRSHLAHGFHARGVEAGSSLRAYFRISLI